MVTFRLRIVGGDSQVLEAQQLPRKGDVVLVETDAKAAQKLEVTRVEHPTRPKRDEGNTGAPIVFAT